MCFCMASPAPAGRGARARKGKRTTEQAQLYEQELEGTKSRAGSKAKAKSRSQGLGNQPLAFLAFMASVIIWIDSAFDAAGASARRLAAPDAADLQYAAQQVCCTILSLHICRRLCIHFSCSHITTL